MLCRARSSLASICLIWCIIVGSSAFANGPSLPAGTRFIMSHFGANTSGGDERLFISISPDGLNWTTLNNGQPVWQPVGWAQFMNVVRDPSIVYKNGFFWVAYTSGNYGRHASFGLVKSSDLLNWTFVQEVNTTIPGATDPITWGPFFFKDADESVHLFVSITPTGGNLYGPNSGMHTYKLQPLNADFTQWSAPVSVQVPVSITNEFWVWREGETYHAIYVDFATPNVAGSYFHATSNNLVTGWGNQRFLGWGSYEGGFVLKNPTTGYRFYIEPGNGAVTGYQYVDYNDAFSSFGPVTVVNSTIPFRSGKVIAAPDTISFQNWTSQTLSSAPANDKLPLADADFDSINNLMECAMGTGPLNHSLKSFTRFNDATGAMRFRYTRSPSLSNVTLSLDSYSDDEEGWQIAQSTMSLRSNTLMSDGRELLEWAEIPAVPARPKHLLRLRATLSPQ